MTMVPMTPAAPTGDDPVPAALQAVIDLFAGPLAKIGFPDVDAALLRRQADEVRTQAIAVARAREQLETAQAQLASRTATLGETAARGVAYARIYAESHPDRQALAGALAALSDATTPTPPSPPPKRRGRPPRQSAELFATATPVDDATS